MKYLKNLMMLLVVATFATTSSAQINQAPVKEELKKERKSPESRAEKQTNKMVKHLDLTEEQAEKIYQINLEYASLAKQKKAERKATLKEKNLKIKEILSEEQAKIFDKKKVKAKKRLKKKRKKRRGERAANNERLKSHED